MPKVDYAALAPQLLDRVGGEGNVVQVSHCATRLRLVLKDSSNARTDEIKNLPGVITVVEAGGQYQVVIGNDVPILYEELGKISKLTSGGGEEAPVDDSGNLFDRFIKLISALINPIIWTLAGSGLILAFLSLAVTLGWIENPSSTYTVLHTAGNAALYFLPVLLAITSARRFKANEMTAVAIAGALLAPEVGTLMAAVQNDGAESTFFGIPLVLMDYSSSMVPIIVAVWGQSWVERWFKRVLPGAIRNFTVPLLVLLIVVPLTFLIIGPITTIISNGIAGGVDKLVATVPWLAGALLGATWQILVIFGLHWGLVPVMIAQLNDPGYSRMAAPLFATVLAQGSATLAVFIRARSAKIKVLAGPAALSGLLAGITEPAIYGVNLPLRRPFVFGCIGGAVGGAIIALGDGASNVFVIPSLIGISAVIHHGSVPVVFTGIGVAMLIGFTLTLALGFKEPDEAAAPDAGVDEPTEPAEPTEDLAAPVPGRAVPLEAVPDSVFSSGALGAGIGIMPAARTGVLEVVAPAAGSMVTVMDSGHAYGIRTDDGVEILVHIGLDTVELKGRGFTPAVGVGDRVVRGQSLAEVDLGVLSEAGYDLTTIVMVTNTATLAAVVPVADGDVTPGDTVLEIDH